MTVKPANPATRKSNNSKRALSRSPSAALFGGVNQDDARILLRHYRALSGDKGDVNAFAGPVFVTTGYGHVLVRPAPSESNVLNHLHPR